MRGPTKVRLQAPPQPPQQESPESDSGSEPEELDNAAKRRRVEAPVGARRGGGGGSGSASDDSVEPSDGADSSGSDDSSSSEDEGAGELTLGQLAALRQDGSTTPAAMKARARALARSAAAKAPLKRGGKHRPAEMSSKRPVPVLRDSLQAPKREARDPRFESLSGGAYVEAKFKKQYAFLFDERLPAERKELRAALKKCKVPERRAELQAQLTRVEQALRNEEARRRKEQFEAGLKAKEREAVKAGKAPFYLKKSEKRRLELLAKYEELKASGRLEKFMAKRRKRNAAKDHRFLPSGRRSGGGGDE